MARHDDWFRLYDSSPVANIDMSAPYRKETSDDDGDTWENPRQTTGEHLRIDMVEALVADRTVEYRDGVVVIQSPHPMGGWLRYTPNH
jgi:hypothetical protein